MHARSMYMECSNVKLYRIFTCTLVYFLYGTVHFCILDIAVCVRTCALFTLMDRILQLRPSFLFSSLINQGVQVKMATFVNDAREVVSFICTMLQKGPL